MTVVSIGNNPKSFVALFYFNYYIANTSHIFCFICDIYNISHIYCFICDIADTSHILGWWIQIRMFFFLPMEIFPVDTTVFQSPCDVETTSCVYSVMPGSLKDKGFISGWVFILLITKPNKTELNVALRWETETPKTNNWAFILTLLFYHMKYLNSLVRKLLNCHILSAVRNETLVYVQKRSVDSVREISFKNTFSMWQLQQVNKWGI